MKNYTELSIENCLRCPVEKGGSVWVEVNFYGMPTVRALDKTLELLTAMRNSFADEIWEESNGNQA